MLQAPQDPLQVIEWIPIPCETWLKRDDRERHKIKSNRCHENVGAVYFGAVGTTALISKSIKKGTVCYEDLGAEAIHRFYVEDFGNSSQTLGNNLYETEPKNMKYNKNSK